MRCRVLDGGYLCDHVLLIKQSDREGGIEGIHGHVCWVGGLGDRGGVMFGGGEG